MESRSRLKPVLSVQILPMGVPQCYQLDETVDWVATLLNELSLEAESSLSQQFTPSFTLSLKLTRRDRDNLGNYLVVEGKFCVHYSTYCVATYQVIEEVQQTEVNAVVISKHHQKSLNLQDEVTLFVDDQERDLFYYDPKVNLVEIIHEYLYLNKNPYPKKVAVEKTSTKTLGRQKSK